MLPNSVSYCRAKPFKVLAAAPRPREKGRFFFYGSETNIALGLPSKILTRRPNRKGFLKKRASEHDAVLLITTSALPSRHYFRSARTTAAHQAVGRVRRS